VFSKADFSPNVSSSPEGENRGSGFEQSDVE